MLSSIPKKYIHYKNVNIPIVFHSHLLATGSLVAVGAGRSCGSNPKLWVSGKWMLQDLRIF